MDAKYKHLEFIQGRPRPNLAGCYVFAYIILLLWRVGSCDQPHDNCQLTKEGDVQ